MLTARRLALIVFAGAGLAIVACYAASYILDSRGSGLALGMSGMFLPTLLFFVVCPILLLDAGALALRRRRATTPEIVVLGILAASVLFLGLLSTTESYLGTFGPEMTLVIGSSWIAICLSALASLVVIIVATIRGARSDAAEATRNEPSEPAADPTR